MTEMTHHQIATLQIEQAGKRLRQHLEADPLNVDSLDDFELQLVVRTQGAGVLQRARNRADQLDREDREVERANRPDERIKRVAFEMQEYRKVPPREDDDPLREERLLHSANPGDDDE